MAKAKRATISKDDLEKLRSVLKAAPKLKKEEQVDFNKREMISKLKSEISQLMKLGYELKQLAEMISGNSPLPISASTLKTYLSDAAAKKTKEKAVNPPARKPETKKQTAQAAPQASAAAEKGSGKFQVKPDSDEI